MTRRLVAAFVLGGLVSGASIAAYFQQRHKSEGERRFNEFVACATEIDELMTVCNEHIDDAELYGQRLFCRLREAERILEPLYPEWRGYFAERDRRQYDEEYGCDGPEMAPHEWTIEELESNAELGR